MVYCEKKKNMVGRTKQNLTNKLSLTDMVERMYTEQSDEKQSDSSDCYDLFTYGESQSL